MVLSLGQKYPNTQFSCALFSHIWTEYTEVMKTFTCSNSTMETPEQGVKSVPI